MKRLLPALIISSLTLISISCQRKTDRIYITPKPQHTEYHGGTTVCDPQKTDSIFVSGMPEESYRLTIASGNIKIEAGSQSGFFYARKTLQQIVESTGSSRLPEMTVEDAPNFSWRGLHLDVSRYFFDVDHIKKQLDAMARYKMNRFHWHLTDGTGWRLQIPGYPRLTEFGAWRPMHSWKEWWFSEEREYSQEGTPGAYGGYYTEDDVKEIIEYAQQRNITVIPEIEFPGHSEEVLASYPEMRCRVSGMEGAARHPSDLCPSNPLTYKFIDDVLEYVCKLFPSEYIHVGGDEVSGQDWELCPDCRRLMKKEGLEDKKELQGHLMQYIGEQLRAKGKTMIGWDEIFYEGLDTNSVVMVWRDEKTGYEAAEKGHGVIMTPGAYCYLNNYQADPETQPEAIGGYLLLENVYSFNPVQTDGRIMGVQACLWAEYLPTYELAEYMLYPRLLAIAETGWTAPEQKDWEDFKARANREIKTLQNAGYHPYTLSPVPLLRQRLDGDTIKVELYSERTPADIRYTTDGSMPDRHSSLYTGPITVSDSIRLCAGLFQETDSGYVMTGHTSRNFYRHKAFGKKVQYFKRIYPDYSAGGETALTDGLTGGFGYGDGRWQGFCPNDMDVCIDLGSKTEISEVKANFMQVSGPYIFLPLEVQVLVSDDGENFRLLGSQTHDIPQQTDKAVFKYFGWKGTPVEARYIRMKASQNKIRGFLFTDEIIVL